MSPSSIFIPLPPWEPIPSLPCSPYFEAITSQSEEAPRPFTPLKCVLPDDAAPSTSSSHTSWHSNFGRLMDDVLETD